MSGSLHSRNYGSHRHSSTQLKKMGHYSSGPTKKLGFYNNAVKPLGLYNGVGGSRNNLIGEIYPRY